MRILVLIHEFPPIGGGGGKIALDIARVLYQRGHQVFVIAPYMKGLTLQSRTDGVHVTRMPSLRRQAYVADLLAMAGYLAVGLGIGLWKIWRERPDLIHVHFAVPAGALAWMLSKITGIPYVLTTHLGDIPGGVPEKTDRWFRWIYPFTPRIWRDAARVTAISSYSRNLALKHYPVEIEVIPNGLDLKSLPAPRLDPDGRTPRIAFAGRLVAQKNPVEVVRILAQLKTLDWTCVLMGGGPLEGDLRREVQAHGLESRLQLTGWLEPAEVIRNLLDSHIALMPSVAEGLPMTGLQSLAAGLAMVTSRAGGLVDLVEDGRNGFLLDSGDRDGFVDRLRSLLSQPELLGAMRRASRSKALGFDLEWIVTEYIRVFEQAISSGGA